VAVASWIRVFNSTWIIHRRTFHQFSLDSDDTGSLLVKGLEAVLSRLHGQGQIYLHGIVIRLARWLQNYSRLWVARLDICMPHISGQWRHNLSHMERSTQSSHF